MAAIAEVYILEVPYHIDRLYSYYIPPYLSDTVLPGAVVEVPFGGANRRMTAAVYNTKESADDGELKPILSAVNVSPPYLSDEALRLCSFLKEHTLCTFGEAVKTVLPSAAISKISEVYTLGSEAGEEAFERRAAALDEKSGFIFAAIRSAGKLSKESLRSRFGGELSSTLTKLTRLGLIEKHIDLREGGANVKSVLVARPTGNTPDKPLKSERQLAVLDALTKTGGASAYRVSDLLGLTPTAVRTAFQALEKKGLVLTERESVYRNSFSLSDVDTTAYSGSFELSEEQSAAYERLAELYRDPVPRGALLHGVTGSGKTNVILKLIDRVLEDGRGVIMLVPEIALTPQTVSRFTSRFGDRIAVIHSSLSAGERFDAWRRIRAGEATVVIGTRSAVFAPVKNLGLIVIDEEHEHTYKSDTDPKYTAHEVASFRCGENRATLVLASATPSVNSYYKAETGKLTLVELHSRYGGAALPEVEVCDMRAELASGNTSPLSRSLIARIGQSLSDGKQTILFLNRRGYNSVISCRGCGEAVKCPSCSVSMTYHVKRGVGVPRDRETGSAYLEVRRSLGYLHCHMCGHMESIPERCPECGSEHFLFAGYGTQLAEDELKRLYPHARVSRMDYDTTRGKASHEELLSSFRRGEADILLGTQMVTKGHDFPNVTTVGILNADSSLFMDDYRAGERTFSMLTQVIGRAGRAHDPGVSVVQTMNPNSDIITLASKQDYKTFYSHEIRLRRELTFPPFCDIVVLTMASRNEATLAQAAKRMGEQIRHHTRYEFTDIKAVFYGPFEAPVYRVQNVFRMRFVIKCRLSRRMRAFVSTLLCDFAGKNGARDNSPVRVSADFNPTNV